MPERTVVDKTAANTYRQTRLAYAEDFSAWVRETGVSADQESRALQVLSDAQGIFDGAAEVRQDLEDEAMRMRNARMSEAQRQKLNDARNRWFAAFKRQDQKEMAEAEEAKSKLWTETQGDLDESATDGERAAFEATRQIDSDLEAQVLAAFGEFLTPRQIEAFESDVGSVAYLLYVSHSRWENEQYAKELAARPH